MRRFLNRRFRPTFDMLETRLVPAVTFQQLDLDGDGAADDIRIVGDSQNSILTIHDSGSGEVVTIDANGDGDFDDAALGDEPQLLFIPIGKDLTVDLHLGGGDDQVAYTATSTFDGIARKILVRLGKGDDVFEFDADGHNLINSAKLKLDIKGSAGQDGVGLFFDAVNSSKLRIQEDLGAGDDSCGINFTGNIDFGASAKMTINLGTGVNSLDMALQGVGFSGGATTAIDITGGDDANHGDFVGVTVHNDIGNSFAPSRLDITANLLAGNDRFIAVIDQDDVRVDNDSVLSIIAHGGAGNDSITAFADGNNDLVRIDSGALLNIELFGDGGKDDVEAVFDTFLPVSDPSIELVGTLRARIDGGDGNDGVFMAFHNTADSSGNYDLKLNAGAGNDRSEVVIDIKNAPVTFDPKGLAVMNGGEGNDTITLSTPQVLVKGFETTL